MLKASKDLMVDNEDSDIVSNKTQQQVLKDSVVQANKDQVESNETK